MALSNDDRNTYKIFDGSNWITTYNNSYNYYLPYDVIRTDKGIMYKN